MIARRRSAMLFCLFMIAHASNISGAESRHPPVGQPSAGCGDFNYGPTCDRPARLLGD